MAKPTGARVDNGSMSGVQLEGISGVLGMKNKLTPIDENEMSFLRMACYSKMKMPIVGHIYLLVDASIILRATIERDLIDWYKNNFKIDLAELWRIVRDRM